LEALKGWWNNNKVTALEAAAKGELPAVYSNSDVKRSEHSTQATPVPLDPLATPSDADVAVTDAQPGNTANIITNSLPPPTIDSSKTISAVTADLTRRIANIYSELPPCTAFFIYSGSGDPREMSRLQAMHSQFKREYRIKKWDQLSVRWTDTEEQALKKAVAIARDGVGFIGVK
jgi:RNA exonuclease 1